MSVTVRAAPPLTVRFMMTGLLLTSVALVFLCGAPSARAQDVPSFEVVSVKPNTSGSEATASYVQAVERPGPD